MEHKFKKFSCWLLISGAAAIWARAAQAHEAYVLTAQRFHQGLSEITTHPLAGLLDSRHWRLTAVLTAAVALVYVLNFLWSATKPAEFLDRQLKKLAPLGPLLTQLSLGLSFLYAAQSSVVLGPELSLNGVWGANLLQFLSFLIGLMFLFGVWAEAASLMGLLIFLYLGSYFGWYMLTYTNYFGEFLVVFLFGSRFLSFDRLAFGTKTLIKKMSKYAHWQIPILRVFYGVALIYAGYTIKFLHQSLTVEVYNQYHLQNFFHASASFIAAGAGLAEILIGLFIVLGFAQRLTVLISLVFITLSLAYFRELVWPHFLLYGISLSLLINSGKAWSLDGKIVPWLKRVLNSSPPEVLGSRQR